MPQGYSASGFFNNGGPMQRRGGGRFVQATWEAPNTPALTNAVYAHEVTHINAQDNANTDADGDNVHDPWETDMFMLTAGQNAEDSYPVFSGSSSNNLRDEEFFAWINACFSAQFNGSIEESNMQGGPYNAIPQTDYEGVVPDAPNASEDWTKNGNNW